MRTTKLFVSDAETGAGTKWDGIGLARKSGIAANEAPVGASGTRINDLNSSLPVRSREIAAPKR